MMKRFIAILCIMLLCFPFYSSAYAKDQVLHIWNIEQYDPRFYYAEARFKEKYPDIAISIQEDYFSKNLINRMLSQDQEVDIIPIQDWNNGVSGRSLLQSGLLADMNEASTSQSLKNQLNKLSDIYCVGDQWYGIQDASFLWVWYGNSALFHEMGLSLPPNDWTWNDFYDLGKQVYEYNQTHHTSYKLAYEDDMCPFVIKQYLYSTTDYVQGTHLLAEPKFQELVSQWLQLREWEVCIDVSDNDSYQQMGYVLPDVLINIRSTTFGGGALANVDPAITPEDAKAAYRMILPPTEDGMHAGIMRSFGYGVTSYSDVKEEAIFFLQCYASPEAWDCEAEFGFPDVPLSPYAEGWSTPFFNNGPLFINDPVLSKISLPDNSWAAENMAYWMTLINDCVQEYYDPDMAQTVCYDFEDGLNALKANRISLDQYIENCCRIADQYLGE